METTELTLLEAIRRVMSRVAGVKMARLVRREERVEVPLSRYVAVILEPAETETLTWPDVPVGAYRLVRWRAAVQDRALPGTRAFEVLAATAEACRAAVAGDPSLGGLAEDGPEAAGGLTPGVGATRIGPARLGRAVPGGPTSIFFDGATGYWAEEMAGAATFDDESLFASGPHVVEVGSPVRRVADVAFNGLAGGLAIDLGEGPREIIQRGVLSASTDVGLAVLEAAVESFVDGRTYSLATPDGDEQPHCRLERFERVGPVRVGTKWHQPYRITYRQMAR